MRLVIERPGPRGTMRSVVDVRDAVFPEPVCLAADALHGYGQPLRTATELRARMLQYPGRALRARRIDWPEGTTIAAADDTEPLQDWVKVAAA